MRPLTAHEQLRCKHARQARQAHHLQDRTWPEDVGELLNLTHHPDARVRKHSVHALCPCSLKASVDRVWDRLLDMVTDDPKVRARVLHTLADGSPREREQEVVRALESMQHDPDAHLRRRVRQLLAHYRAGGRLNVL